MGGDVWRGHPFDNGILTSGDLYLQKVSVENLKVGLPDKQIRCHVENKIKGGAFKRIPLFQPNLSVVRLLFRGTSPD